MGLGLKSQRINFSLAENYQKYIDYGVTVTKLPDEDVPVLIKLRNEVMTEKADENPLFKEIWLNQENFIKAYRELREWGKVPVEAYELAEE